VETPESTTNKVCCEGAHPLRGTLNWRGFNDLTHIPLSRTVGSINSQHL